MGGLFKNLFKKEDKKKKKLTPRNACPINLQVDDVIQVHKDETIPKLWKGVINSVTDSAFALDIPELMGEFPFPFKEGSSMNVSVAKDDQTAKFSSKLLRIAWKSKPPILILEFPDDTVWEKTKPREYIRIETDLPAKLKIEGKQDSWQLVRISDFSLTGLQLTSPKAYMQGERIRINFMQFQFPLEPISTVMWCTREKEKGTGEELQNYNIGLKFEELSAHDRTMLSSFAYKLQRKNYSP